MTRCSLDSVRPAGHPPGQGGVRRWPPPMKCPPLLRAALRKPAVLAATKVAAVVGSILNLINQGDALVHGELVSWPHLVMNYMVPFCVSSYSAARNELANNRKREDE